MKKKDENYCEIENYNNDHNINELICINEAQEIFILPESNSTDQE